MYLRYQCIHWHKFENDRVERILSCKCTVLRIFDIFLYLYIGQSCVYFGHAKHDQTFYLILYLHVESKHGTLLFVSYRYIPIRNTKQYINKIKYALHHSQTFTNVHIEYTLKYSHNLWTTRMKTTFNKIKMEYDITLILLLSCYETLLAWCYTVWMMKGEHLMAVDNLIQQEENHTIQRLMLSNSAK